MWYKFTGNPKEIFFGHLKKDHGKHPDRVLDFWVLGIINSGNMGLNTGGETASLKAGSFYLLPPGIRHFGTDDLFNDVFWVHFKMATKTVQQPQRVDLKSILLPVFGSIPPELPFTPLMEAMSKLSMQAFSSDEMLGSVLKTLLFTLSIHEQKNSLKQSPATKIAYELFRYLETNISENLQAAALEKKFGYCYPELNGFFKKQFGTTIKQKVIDMKMSKAFELLARGEKIATVAERLGFNDYYYFLKLFKKTKKITPKQLKKYYL